MTNKKPALLAGKPLSDRQSPDGTMKHYTLR